MHFIRINNKYFFVSNSTPHSLPSPNNHNYTCLRVLMASFVTISGLLL